jgi:hypothetical protein
VKRDTATTFASSLLMEEYGFASKPIRFEISATTIKGKINVAAVPAAPPPN